MKNFSQLTLLIIFTLFVIISTSCGNDSSTSSTQDTGNRSFAATTSNNIVVLDDLDPGFRSAPLIVDTSEIDTTSGIILGNNVVINGDITRNSTNSGFILSDGTTGQYNINFSPNIDTLKLADMELYYALPATMNNDTVRVLVPRRYILPPSPPNGNGRDRGNGGGNNSN